MNCIVLVFSYNEQYLALSRKDSSIEIWDVWNLPVLKTFIPPLPDVSSILISSAIL